MQSESNGNQHRTSCWGAFRARYFIECVLRKQSPDEKVIRVFPTRTLDDEANQYVVARVRFVANGPNRMGKVLKIEQFKPSKNQ